MSVAFGSAYSRFLCWLGLHKIVYTKTLLTMKRCECANCGRKFVDTFYGLFDVD